MPPSARRCRSTPARRSAAAGVGRPGAGSGRPRPGGSATRRSGRCSRRHWRSCGRACHESASGSCGKVRRSRCVGGAKPAKAKGESTRPVARKSGKGKARGGRPREAPGRDAGAAPDAQPRTGRGAGQQRATSEILRAISNSPTDIQPVFDVIAQSARRLCDGNYCTVARYDGELVHLAAHAYIRLEGVEAMQRFLTKPPSRRVSARPHHPRRRRCSYPRRLADPEYDQSVAQAVQFRSIVGVPMLRDGASIGAITVSRAEARPFTETEIALAEDVRRPGRHRHRKRPVVQGTRGKEPRPD